jgi:hypothetical protein
MYKQYNHPILTISFKQNDLQNSVGALSFMKGHVQVSNFQFYIIQTKIHSGEIQSTTALLF